MQTRVGYWFRPVDRTTIRIPAVATKMEITKTLPVRRTSDIPIQSSSIWLAWQAARTTYSSDITNGPIRQRRLLINRETTPLRQEAAGPSFTANHLERDATRCPSKRR